jgi:hypothetical protein
MAREEIDEEKLWERATGKKRPTRIAEPLFRVWSTFRERPPSGPEPKSRLEEQVVSIRDERLFRVWRDLIEKVVYAPEPKSGLEERVESLEDEVRKLKSILTPKREALKADIIYEKFKEELESKYWGKIVAIDIESETIAGIGDSILEAYQKARLKFPKNKFAYKRIGYTYVLRL